MVDRNSYIIYDSINKAVFLQSLNSGSSEVIREFLAYEEGSDKVKFVSMFMDEHKILDSSESNLRIPKCDEKSAEYRIQGNKFYANNEFIDAVEMYNKSLCFATSSRNLALAYANRSAVCFSLEMYSTCLSNIEWARENDYPAEKMSTLELRAEKCRRLIAEGATSDDSLLELCGEEYLKLTHPAHPKLPFIADCLDIKSNEEFGRHVITKKRLCPGDIVCIESPFANHLWPSHLYKHCYHCSKNSWLTLIPCQLNTEVMFCSEKCRSEAFGSYYKYTVDIINEITRTCPNLYMSTLQVFFEALTACDGSLEKLKEVYDEADNNPGLTILDVDNPYDPINKFRVINTCQTHEDKRDPMLKFLYCGTIARIVHLFLHYTKLTDLIKTEDDRDFYRSFLYRHAQIAMVNNHEVGTSVKKKSEIVSGIAVSSSQGIFPFTVMLSHSCSSNVERVCGVDKFYLFVVRTIEPNEQLFDRYCCAFDFEDLATRQKMIRKNYLFDCKCEACLNDWPTRPHLPLKILKKSRLTTNFIRIQQQMLGVNPERAKKAFKMICKFLLLNQNLHPCQEIISVQDFLLKCYELFLLNKLTLKLLH